MPTLDQIDKLADLIAKLLIILIVTWPFIGIVIAILIYHLYRVAITRSGVQISCIDSEDERTFIRMIVCFLGAIFGWVMWVILPFALLLWLVFQTMFLVSGEKKVFKNKKFLFTF